MNKQTKDFRKDPKKFMIGHSWNHVVSNWYLIGIFLTWWEAGLSNSSSKVIQSLNIIRAASKWLGTSSFIVTGTLSSNITFPDTVRWKQPEYYSIKVQIFCEGHLIFEKKNTVKYKHSSIYTFNVGTHTKTRKSKTM